MMSFSSRITRSYRLLSFVEGNLFGSGSCIGLAAVALACVVILSATDSKGECDHAKPFCAESHKTRVSTLMCTGVGDQSFPMTMIGKIRVALW